jgi:hypothetical protein
VDSGAAALREGRLRILSAMSSVEMRAMTRRLPPQGQSKTSNPQVRLSRSAQSRRGRSTGGSNMPKSPGVPFSASADGGRRAGETSSWRRGTTCLRSFELGAKTPKNTLNGARVGDIFMSLIHTTELSGAQPFDYLVAVLRNHEAAAAEPSLWLPWNFREALAELAASRA